MSDPQRVLLIGGGGLLGRPLAHALRSRGHHVTVLTRGRSAPIEGAEHLVADRHDRSALALALEGRRFDFCVDFLVFDPVDVERLLLVPYAALGRFVMISTGQVYLVADGAEPPYREEDAERDARAEPPAGTDDHGQWSYGTGKRRAERLLFGLRATHGLRALALRLPIVQGESDGSLRLWGLVERLLDGGPLLLPAGGTQPTRHVYRGDVTTTLVRMVEGLTPRQAAYNLCQPEIVPLRALIERIAAIAGVAPRLVDVGWNELGAAGLDRDVAPYSGPWCSLVDPSRAAGEWGFTGTRLEDYLPQVVRWHLEHRPTRSHPGYAHRAREIELAQRLGTVGSKS